VNVDNGASAILVHGSWGNPEDWRWVRERLDVAGVSTATPDLPSHRSARAGFLDDVATVRAVIRGVGMPVVVVGWSYGCDVVAAAAVGEAVTRLVFVSSLPTSLPKMPATREETLRFALP
jgi:pimeloyl-ACP methyl ester carboxylesterase